MQAPLTTITPNGIGVRTAQGFHLLTGLPSYSSFYREIKVSEEKFGAALNAARTKLNILEEDECGWEGVTRAASGTDCETHFGP